MSRHRGPRPVLLETTAPPTATAIRRPGPGHDDPPVWVIHQCPYCRRRHHHPADPVATSLVITARCSPARFYKIQESDRSGITSAQ